MIMQNAVLLWFTAYFRKRKLNGIFPREPKGRRSEEGKLNLSNPVASHLPAQTFHHDEPDAEESESRATIRHLVILMERLAEFGHNS